MIQNDIYFCSLWSHICELARDFTYSGVLQALIWSKMSTGLPIEIASSMRGQNFKSFCKLDIDIHKYVSKIMY